MFLYSGHLPDTHTCTQEERKNEGESAKNKKRGVKKMKRTNLVNRLELLCDCKYSLDVVVAQLLNQVSNGGIVLGKKMEEKSRI